MQKLTAEKTELEERLGVLQKQNSKLEVDLRRANDVGDEQARRLEKEKHQLELDNQKLHCELLALQARPPEVKVSIYTSTVYM